MLTKAMRIQTWECYHRNQSPTSNKFMQRSKTDRLKLKEYILTHTSGVLMHARTPALTTTWPPIGDSLYEVEGRRDSQTCLQAEFLSKTCSKLLKKKSCSTGELLLNLFCECAQDCEITEPIRIKSLKP